MYHWGRPEEEDYSEGNKSMHEPILNAMILAFLLVFSKIEFCGSDNSYKQRLVCVSSPTSD